MSFLNRIGVDKFYEDCSFVIWLIFNSKYTKNNPLFRLLLKLFEEKEELLIPNWGIVGWQLHPTLSKDGPIEALKKAIDFYRANHVNPAGLIHHSDRGTQYCCNEYIALLQDLGIRASMTQTGDPLHNALAERINNTVKNGWLFETQEKSFEEVKELVQKAVDIYNRVRPHQSLEMRTPLEEMKRLLEQAA